MEKEESLELKRQYEIMIQSIQEKEKTLADLAPAVADAMADEDAEPVPATFADLERGDTVRILSLDTVGEVVGKIRDKNKLVVRANMMKVEVRPEDLEIVTSR